jgi:hypothetical protein
MMPADPDTPIRSTIPGGNPGRKLHQRPSPRTTKALDFQGFRFIAGEGLIAKPATTFRAWALWDLAGQRWICERIW